MSATGLSADGSVIIELELDYSGFERDLQRAQSAAEMAGKKMESALGGVGGVIDGLGVRLQSLESSLKRVGDAMRNASTSAGGTAKYAAGTGAAASGWALVGEQGPELVLMRGGEQVLNAARTADLLAAGSAGAQRQEGSYVDNRSYNLKVDDLALFRRIASMVEAEERGRVRGRAKGG